MDIVEDLEVGGDQVALLCSCGLRPMSTERAKGEYAPGAQDSCESLVVVFWSIPWSASNLVCLSTRCP
jgi:hypothetical protein